MLNSRNPKQALNQPNPFVFALVCVSVTACEVMFSLPQIGHLIQSSPISHQINACLYYSTAKDEKQENSLEIKFWSGIIHKKRADGAVGTKDEGAKTMSKENGTIQTILWDIDGTLLNFEQAERAALHACFGVFGLGVCSDEMLRHYSAINRGYWQRLERGELR